MEKALTLFGAFWAVLCCIALVATFWVWVKPHLRTLLQACADALEPDPYEGREYARPKSVADERIETEEP
jgi:hypothetical protein